MDRPIPGEAGIASDAEIRSELAEFRNHLDGIDPRKGARAYVDKDGRAVLPKGAPRAASRSSSRRRTRRHQALQVGRWARRVEGLGLRLLGLRVVRAGGRAATREPARLEWPEALRRWGAGRWITIHSNPGHVFMTVAGLRFETSGQGSAGTRWQPPSRSTGGFTVRHPPGL